MKAIVHKRYGRPELLELRDIDEPVIEGHQVLLRVHASSINPVEWYQVTGPWFARFGNGLRQPKTKLVGADVAGRIEAVGADVKDFGPGDEVFGTAAGAWAEYQLPARFAWRRSRRTCRSRKRQLYPWRRSPPCRRFATKDASRPGSGADQRRLRRCGDVRSSVGEGFGADVTGVCSTQNVELVRSLGADRVVDYTQRTSRAEASVTT